MTLRGAKTSHEGLPSAFKPIKMSKAKERFEIQLAKVEALLQQAKTQKNAALWLSNNNLRTPLFNLEALAKMYGSIYPSKDFRKIEKQAKEIEDALGSVDHYQAQLKQVSANSKLPAQVKKYFKDKTTEALQHLNELLADENWLNGKRPAKMAVRINRTKWMKEKDDTAAIAAYYEKEIKEIATFVAAANGSFTQMEEQVHELRRKIRWLSIYPQALNGLVELVNRKTTPKHFDKYMTEAVVKSPFNQLQPNADLGQHLQLYRQNYLALSWMIAELGKIKDAGLTLHAICEAMVATGLAPANKAEAKALQLLGKKQRSTAALLAQASDITREYFSKKLLEGLVVK